MSEVVSVYLHYNLKRVYDEFGFTNKRADDKVKWRLCDHTTCFRGGMI